MGNWCWLLYNAYLMKCTFFVLSAMNIEKPELGGPIENWNESPSMLYRYLIRIGLATTILKLIPKSSQQSREVVNAIRWSANLHSRACIKTFIDFVAVVTVTSNRKKYVSQKYSLQDLRLCQWLRYGVWGMGYGGMWVVIGRAGCRPGRTFLAKPGHTFLPKRIFGCEIHYSHTLPNDIESTNQKLQL